VPKRKRWWTVVLAAGAVVVAGLGSASLYLGSRHQSSGPLEDRVREFWDAKVDGDLARAYSLEAASQTGQVDLSGYVRKRSSTIKYLGYDIKSIQENADRARVDVEFKYEFRSPRGSELKSTSRIRESWMKLNDTWYRETKTGPAPLVATH
jgi:hypothetical protein